MEGYTVQSWMTDQLGAGPMADVAAWFLQEAVYHPTSLGPGVDTQDVEVALLMWLWISIEHVDLATVAQGLFRYASSWHPYVQSCTRSAIP